MEERVEYAMTDYQFDGIIKMVMMLVAKCETSGEAVEELSVLLRSEQSAAEVMAKIEESKARKNKNA